MTDLLNASQEFLTSAIATRQITDAVSGTKIPVPLAEGSSVKVTFGMEAGKEHVVFTLPITHEATINQKPIGEAATALLKEIPSLSALTPTHGSWQGNDDLTIRFDLPEDMSPASVLKEIAAMRKGAELLVSTAQQTAAAETLPTPSTDLPAAQTAAAPMEKEVSVPVATEPMPAAIPAEKEVPVPVASEIAASKPKGPMDHATRLPSQVQIGG